MRGFDIDHHVEGLIAEGQVLGVALHEIQAGHVVPFSAKVDAGLVQIQPRVGGRAQGTHEVRGSAAVTATDLQHPFAVDIHLSCRAVVELHEVPVGLIGRRQWQAHRRILLVAGVEEQHFISAELAGEDGVPVLR